MKDQEIKATMPITQKRKAQRHQWLRTKKSHGVIHDTTSKVINEEEISQKAECKGLVVKMSNIWNAGRGVFVLRPFSKNQYITKYAGRMAKPSDEESEDWQRYGLTTPKGVIIGDKDFTDIDNGVAQLINDPLCEKLNPGCRINCYFGSIDGEICAIASRDINAHEELYVSYGFQYWQWSCNKSITQYMSVQEKQHFLGHVMLEQLVNKFTRRYFLSKCMTTISSSQIGPIVSTEMVVVCQQQELIKDSFENDCLEGCQSTQFIMGVENENVQGITCYECLGPIRTW